MITYVPQLTKTWNVTPNKRNPYTSLSDMSAWCMYENKAAMLLSGWTLIWSCNGVTGPASALDNTDRWLTKANAQTRGTTSGTAQSWVLLQNTAGAQIRISYLGATDDIFAITYSPGGLYGLQGTTTFPPIATDEVILTSANSMINSTASADRVMSIFCTSDSLHWRFVVYRAGVLLNYIAFEWANTYCPVGVFGNGAADQPFFGCRLTNTGRDPATLGTIIGSWPNIAIGAAGALGCMARVFTGGAARNIRANGRFAVASFTPGTVQNGATTCSTTVSNTPAAQGGGTWPMELLELVGERAANMDGAFGQFVDWWIAPYSSAVANTPNVGDFCTGYEPADTPGVTVPRTNWIVSLSGGVNLAWKNAAPTFETV